MKPLSRAIVLFSVENLFISVELLNFLMLFFTFPVFRCSLKDRDLWNLSITISFLV